MYAFGETLGEGAFGKVSKAIFKPTGEAMAVKVIKEERMGAAKDRMIRLSVQEAEILNRLDHPNVLKVRHLIKLNEKLFMGMEVLTGGRLSDYIDKRIAESGKMTDLEAS